MEFASKEGLVLREAEFVAIINHDLESHEKPKLAHARVILHCPCLSPHCINVEGRSSEV